MKPYIKQFIEAHDKNDVMQAMIEKGITPEKRIRNYMIIADYNQMQVDNEYLPGYLKKSAFQIWMELAEKYEISERQAQGIIQKWRKKFKN